MHGTIDDVIILRDVMVPMRDGVCLATDITLPARGGQPLPGPFPTLVHRTPYDKSAARLSEVSVADPVPRRNLQIAADLSRAGYVVLNQDCRGRYRSEGVFCKYIGEGEDGFDTLNWARAQSWCNGDFGTFGLSYSAHVQTALAALRPEGLKAMFLDSGGFWNGYQGGIRRGGAFEMKQVTWAYKHARLSEEAADPVIAAALEAENIADWILGGQWSRGKSPMRHVPAYDDYLFDQWERSDFDSYWKQPDLYFAPLYETLAQCPVFLISGWFDPYAETMFEHFKGLSAVGGFAEIVIGPWLHGRRSVTYAGGAEFGLNAVLDGQIAPDYQTLRQGWFDRWLLGKTTTDRPKVQWFAMGTGSGTKSAEGRINHGGLWRSDVVWPPQASCEIEYYLSQDCGLSTTPAAPGAARLVSDPERPVPTLGGALTSGEPVMVGGIFDQVTTPTTFGAQAPFGPLGDREDVLSFMTEPLAEAVEIAGPLRLVLTLSADVPDMDLTLKLIDQAPASADFPHGFAVNLTDSILRLKYRNGFDVPELLPVGQPISVTLNAPPIANIFAKGHRIRVDISGSNFPKYDVNPQTGQNPANATERRVATAILQFGGAQGARLILPVCQS